MKMIGFILFAVALGPSCAFATDGQILISQASVTAAGGFPYVISQSGSYKLSGNLVVSASKDGIDINVSNVTLDLNGFTIAGPGPVACSTPKAPNGPPCSGFNSGIISAPNLYNVAVLNGAVVGFSTGVDLSGGYPYGYGYSSLVQEIRASGNNGNGIVLYAGIVRRSTASFNATSGIECWFNCVIVENVAAFNGGVGMSISGGIVGSNALSGNPFNFAGKLSQGNNSCDNTAC